jgi:hypothetical protein
MRSHELPVSGEYETASASDLLTQHAAEALARRHADLTEQHHDLDYMISALIEQPTCDELLVARLKKRKLHLKDDIARVAAGFRAAGDATANA